MLICHDVLCHAIVLPRQDDVAVKLGCRALRCAAGLRQLLGLLVLLAVGFPSQHLPYERGAVCFDYLSLHLGLVSTGQGPTAAL